MAQLHQELAMDLNPDSVEWCPNEACRNFVAVSTYQLDQASATRIGRLHGFELRQDAERDIWQLHPTAQLDCSGIFDARWASHTQAPLLALGLADGTVRLVQPVDDNSSWDHVCDVDVQGGMVLTTDWARHAANAGRIVASTSSGHLATVQAAGAALRVTETWNGHDLEAWSIAADCWQADVVYSGSDDCTLKGWDLRQATRMPAFLERHTHSAGVCCIQSSPAIEHLLVTGSYDGKVRSWDLRMLRRPTFISQLATHGGVWRLKWHPRDPCLLLAACMDKGFSVVRLSTGGTGSNIELAEDYPHQKTLGYGADWCHLPPEKCPSLVATCSFYDRLLHLWQPTTEVEA